MVLTSSISISEQLDGPPNVQAEGRREAASLSSDLLGIWLVYISTAPLTVMNYQNPTAITALYHHVILDD